MSGAARSKRYADANREKVRAARRASYAKNPAVELSSSKKWKSNNVDRINSNRRAAYAENLHTERANARAKQAARRAGDGNAFTDDDVHLIWELQEGLCFYCSGDTNSRTEHVDHFVPLILGGSNARFNIVVACRTCNCRKGGKSPLEFMGFAKFKFPPLWHEFDLTKRPTSVHSNCVPAFRRI